MGWGGLHYPREFCTPRFPGWPPGISQRTGLGIGWEEQGGICVLVSCLGDISQNTQKPRGGGQGKVRQDRGQEQEKVKGLGRPGLFPQDILCPGGCLDALFLWHPGSQHGLIGGLPKCPWSGCEQGFRSIVQFSWDTCLALQKGRSWHPQWNSWL